MRKVLLLLTVCTLTMSALWAQNRVSGTVQNEAGEPMFGVTVVVNGTTVGVITDAEGKFSLSVPSEGTALTFSFLGYKRLQEDIGSRSTIDVTLIEDILELEEVVVTANAIVREKKELGYAVTKVGGDELVKARETNVVNSLAGKVAGVRVTSQSGSVGGSSKIIIRGANSLLTETSSGSNQPLFVIDGMPVSNSGFNGTRTDVISGGVDVGNRAGDINPDDVESMTVLKGAAATALYGSRAKNGAIIITTKRGSRNLGASISINSSVRFDNVLKLPEFQNEYASGDFGEYDLGNFTNGWGPKISEVQDQQFPDFRGELVTLEAQPDNVKDFYETGITLINSVSVSDGNEKSDFRLGYTNIDQTGTVPNSNLKRNTVSLNSGRDLGNNISARISASYVKTTSQGRAAQGSNNPNIIASLINGMPRHTVLEDLKNNLVDPDGNTYGQDNDSNGSRSTNNPYWVTTNNLFTNQVDRIFGTGELQYDPFPWLNLTGRVGSDFFTEQRRFVNRKGTLNLLQGSFDTREIFSTQFNSDLLATVNFDLSPDLTFSGIVGHNIFTQKVRRTRVQSAGLAVDLLYNFANAQTNATTNTLVERRLYGVYGDITLGYKGWLFLNATGRNDWNSTLPIDNRSYFYPSVSGSLVFTEALGMDSDILNYGKVRVNFANVGSALDPYQLDFTYLPLANLFTQFVPNNVYPHGGQIAFAATDVLPEPNLLPQNQRSFEIGAELVLLGGRVRLDAAYYNTVTDDQILRVSVPQSTGFESKLLNAGSVSNEGVEIFLELSPFKNPGRKAGSFNWDVSFNFSANQNRVEELVEGLDQLTLTSGFSGIRVRAEPGEPFSLFGADWQRDSVSGKPIINPETGLRQLGDGTNLGSIYPDWMLGINNSFTWKGFNLSFLIYIREGGVLYSSTVQSLRSQGLAIETAANRDQVFIDDGVIDNGDGTFRPNDVPVESMQQFWSNYSANSATTSSVFDASYVKLREVRFGYTFPASWLEKSPFKSIRLAVEGRNLWIIQDHIPHIDPEVNFFGTSFTGEGVEFNSVPSNRSIGFNLGLTF